MRQYYIYVTNSCNLKCKYCDGIDIHHNKIEKTKNGINIKQTVQAINSDLKKRPASNPKIIFYGGEPCLRPDIISNLINNINNNGIEFVLHTNGTLLDSLDNKILNKIQSVIISIDGNKKNNDLNRGEGTYEIIMKNLEYIKDMYQGHISARLSLVPNASLYNAVSHLFNNFNSLYWQLENSDDYKPNPSKIFDSYKKDLNKLLDFWLKSISNDKMINIIPFQFAFKSLLYENNNIPILPPCGAADGSIVYITLDGKCYICDKLIGNENFSIGNIDKGINAPNTPFFDANNSSICKVCSYKHLCRGRCVAEHFLFSASNIDFYCKTQQIFWNSCINKLEEVRNLEENGLINQQNLCNKFLELHECVP